jgi:hypothetical protein
MQAANYPTLDTIFAQIDNRDEKTVKNWVKQTLLHHPSIILHYPVKKPSHKQHNIIQEIKTVISTINRGGTLRSDTINNISGIFISEAMNHEHMGHYNEAVEIYQTLYDELQKILLEYHISPHEIPIMATARERQKNLIQKILKSANSSTNSEITTNRKVS